MTVFASLEQQPCVGRPRRDTVRLGRITPVENEVLPLLAGDLKRDTAEIARATLENTRSHGFAISGEHKDIRAVFVHQAVVMKLGDANFQPFLFRQEDLPGRIELGSGRVDRFGLGTETSRRQCQESDQSPGETLALAPSLVLFSLKACIRNGNSYQTLV